MIKKFFKHGIFLALAALTRVRVRRTRPFIIGITGSVGKTSTKDALYTILSSRYRVLRNEKSFNTEFGLPLTILEQPSGFSSFSQWARILLRSCWKACFARSNTRMMVLEMGVDKPKDMDVLLSMVKPHIGVITAIKPVHLAEGQFQDVEDILREKSKLVRELPRQGIAVLNVDDPRLARLADELHCQKLLYGTDEKAQLRAVQVEGTASGITCTLEYKSEKITTSMHLLGEFQIYVILPAIAVALTQGFSLREACAALQNYRLPPGRMNVLKGIEDSTLIDSSYNASPETMREALKVLRDYPGKHRTIAVLGSMNELGRKSEQYHRDLGAVAALHADTVVTVGREAAWIAEGAKVAGMEAGKVISYPNVEEAVLHFPSLVQKGDIILLKGSQNDVRLEKLVKELLRDPDEAERVLVRQNWGADQ